MHIEITEYVFHQLRLQCFGAVMFFCVKSMRLEKQLNVLKQCLTNAGMHFYQ